MKKVCLHIPLKNGDGTFLINPKAVTWHLRASEGGIRSFPDPSLYAHDEEVFTRYLNAIGTGPKPIKLVILDSGLGDHLAMRQILPELKIKYPNYDITIAACYPEVFQNDGVRLISIADAHEIARDMDAYNIYIWCILHNWNKSMVDAYREMYL